MAIMPFRQISSRIQIKVDSNNVPQLIYDNKNLKLRNSIWSHSERHHWNTTTFNTFVMKLLVSKGPKGVTQKMLTKSYFDHVFRIDVHKTIHIFYSCSTAPQPLLSISCDRQDEIYVGNWLVSVRCGGNFINIFKLIILNDGLGIHHDIVIRWMPHDLTNEKSTLVILMAWNPQATRHYHTQCWTSCMSAFRISKP